MYVDDCSDEDLQTVSAIRDADQFLARIQAETGHDFLTFLTILTSHISMPKSTPITSSLISPFMGAFTEEVRCQSRNEDLQTNSLPHLTTNQSRRIEPMTNQDELKLAHSGAWSDDEIKRLENMVASGFTNELIAKALGRKLQPVATRCII